MRRLFAVVAVFPLWFLALRAGDPQAIPNIVSERTAICVVVRDLSGLMKDERTRDTLSKLGDTPAFRAIFGTQDLKKLAEAARFLVGQTGLTPEQWIDDIFGDLALVAYQPGPPGKPDQESGLFALKPRRPESLRKLVDQLNALQLQSGEVLKLREEKSNGIAYTVRPTNKGTTEAYAFHDGLFLFATRETALRELLEDKRPKLDLNVQLAQLGMARERFAVLFQPRAFDAELAAGERDAKSDSDRAFVSRFRKIWSGLSCLGISLSFGPTIELRAAARWTTPEAMAAVGYRAVRPTAPGPRFPSQALIASAGKIEAKALLEFIRGFLSVEGRKELDELVNDVIGPAVGKDRLPLLLEKLGPDWQASVEPPKAERDLLPRWKLAIRLGSSPQDADELHEPVCQGVEFLAQQYRFAYNRTHVDQIRLARRKVDTIDLVTLENDTGFADGWKPTFGVQRGYLVLASDAESVVRFDPEPSVEPQPLAKVNTARWVAYLTPRLGKIAALFAKLDGKSARAHEENLTRIAQLLDLFEDLRLDWKTADDSAVLIFRAKLNLSASK